MSGYPALTPYQRGMIAAQRYLKCRPPEGYMMDQYINEQGETVTAKQLTVDYFTVISVWCHGQQVVEHDALDYEMTFPALNVPTADGPKRASQGDYVVRLPDGSFDVRKAYDFRSKFTEV